MKRQPPLKALRAFEAAGRHLSISKAADELSVSAGAVSQQIKLLEEFLDTPVFDRQHRKVVLTDAGSSLLTPLSSALDQISEAISRVKVDQGNRPITVSAAPSVATRWLVPRAASFFPEVSGY